MDVAINFIVSNGCIVSGGRVQSSVLSPGVRVNSFCEIDRSILMPNVHIGRNSRVRRAIINNEVHLPEGSCVGYDENEDRAKGYLVTESGITVVPG